MRDYILEIARDLYHDKLNVDVDEIAAIGRIKTTHVLGCFPSIAALRTALDEEPRLRVRYLVGK
jgi:hypothetical protein